MAMTLLSLLWVSAHHCLRRGRSHLGVDDSPRLWAMVHEITRELGWPAAPGGSAGAG